MAMVFVQQNRNFVQIDETLSIPLADGIIEVS